MPLRDLLARGRRGLARRLPQRTQLVMWFPTCCPVPGCPLSSSFMVDGFRVGDEAAWSELLDESGTLGPWNQERIRREMAGMLWLEGQRFVRHDHELVACAGVYERSHHGYPAWEIGWVATRNSYRGRGLGAQVTAAALAACRSRRERPVYLRTDDFRLAAIGCYLKLGFVPDCTYSGHAQRWRALRSALPPRHAEFLRQLPG